MPKCATGGIAIVGGVTAIVIVGASAMAMRRSTCISGTMDTTVIISAIMGTVMADTTVVMVDITVTTEPKKQQASWGCRVTPASLVVKGYAAPRPKGRVAGDCFNGRA